MTGAGLTTVFPDAPAVPYTLNGGQPQTVWFDRVAMDYEAPEDEIGLRRSVEQVDKEIDRLVSAGLPMGKIGVAGFSMGAGLALHVGYGIGRYAGRLGMVASLSTFLARDSCFDAKARAKLAEPGSSRTPLLMAHGQHDPMIKLEWAQATHKRLVAAGVPVAEELLTFPGLGHDLCAEEVQLFLDFTLRHLGNSEKELRRRNPCSACM
ncbi:unnamed protein product [Polarella glacialis]|uniref:Phospholipase/carboxylesterase/thioesterase domain-containing protein n=1 Tax=Polarella glacialis TaxID=89957 RepID=A0A813KJY2_POLGL|nr:unnamed protein product [Polarella glacialis]